MQFSDFNLNSSLLNALTDLNITTATTIQEKAFPVIMSGRDMVGIAQTGTGKTISYLLPCLRQWKFSKEKHPTVLVVVPTRELVLQVVEDVEALTKYMNIRVAGVYGGVNMIQQTPLITAGLDILVATPGRLLDHHGQPRSLADYRGKVVTLFFGYVQCPDVCPTNLSGLAEVMRQLGPDADKVQVLFMTVDPERDTQTLLAEYVPAFDARFVGLYGDLPTTRAVAADFKVFYQKQGDVNGKAYTVDHSTGTYVFDPQGHLRLYVKHAEKPELIAADIGNRLAGK